MAIRLNLERGFRRITWLISASLFTVGAIVTFFEWQTARNLWDRAGDPQPKGPPVAYVARFGLSGQFPEDFTAEQIKEVFDRQGVQKLKEAGAKLTQHPGTSKKLTLDDVFGEAAE